MNGRSAGAAQTRLSRETRRLLTAAVLALVALLVLARIRFPERSQPGPIPPLLAQLSPRPSLETIAEELGRVQQRVVSSMVVLPDTLVLEDGTPRAGLRIGVDTAITQLDSRERRGRTAGGDVIALDPVTGLTIVRVTSREPSPLPASWSPGDDETPKFFAVADVLGDRVSLRPVFVAGFQAIQPTGWSDRLWQIPSNVQLPGGALVFTSGGELAGLVVRDGTLSAIVPAETLLFDAQRLFQQRSRTPGVDLGISTRPLTPSLAAATGARQGAVVTAVYGTSPGVRRLAPGDVIGQVNGVVVNSPEEWEERLARVTPGDVVDLIVWRGGRTREVSLTTEAAGAVRPSVDLGLSLLWVTGLGSEVVHVVPGSPGEAAGLIRGDIITSIGPSSLPTPGRLQTSFADTERGRSLVLGFLRGGAPDVVAVVKP